MVKVRFAPSPTGFLHIGGARTALFNWMYARSQGGSFVLRIEDTDLQRSRKEFEEEILESMRWLGFEWDELYYQSQRFDLYRSYADKLLEEGKAYKDGDAIILRMPEQEIKLYDVIRGEIQFDSSTLKDQVLFKSDGSPTYGFACVLDDALMEITHVIRGEDHISNTPKQMVIYEALGFKVPKYAHLPLILGEDGSRLSKRTGAVAVSDYRKEGFLPKALVNYLMLLGWSPGNNQEVIESSAALKKFSLKKVNKAAAVFSMDKLRWVNAQYIKGMPLKELMALMIPFLKEKECVRDDVDEAKVSRITGLYQSRMPTLNDFIDRTDFFFREDVVIAPEDLAALKSGGLADVCGLVQERLKDVEPFTADAAESVFKSVLEERGLKAGDLVHPLRMALTGKGVGPSLFAIMEVLGREKTIQRLTKVFS